MSSFEVNYEEDLIPRIRDLIDGYDKDSILKEYLQNADDSGATELIVTFDKQDYSKLNNTKFKHANNFSLLLYNNSQFKEKDFKSIIKIGAQGKTNDANSTGRFGQGFSSSFSISDHPSFISNGRAYWFDVLKTSVSKDKNNTIQGWEYNNSNEIKEWLKTFKNVGFDREFNGTIFRLPLRDDKTSKESKISNEIFTFDDFLKWVDGWKKNSDSLLFLRHIHRLVLQEIDETGKKIVHLDIKTENEDEIEKINNQIQREFDNSSSLLDICQKWEEDNNKLPFFLYKHHFKIKYFDRDDDKYFIDKKVFSVSNGLFRGEDNRLIESAKKVLNITPNPRKVLPWVGVAVEIDDKNKPIKNKSNFFTFLPLPINSNYPVYIHGWFDLNPKRTDITSVGSGYDKETLVEWNRLLLEEGVAKAWALIIDDLKVDKNSHYNFWAKDTEFGLNEKFIRGFYKNISELNCLYTMNQERECWLSPKENSLYYFKDEKNQILLDAFKEHFPIVYPKPQSFIIENFKNIGIELIEITPKFIRDYLQEKSKDIKFPVAIEKIPITMLQKKEWLIEIMKYCADNGEDYSLLDDLPLKLTLNKSIYKVESDTLFDKSPNLELFQNMKQLYIDVDIINSIENSNKLPSSWLKPTLKNQFGLLLETSNWEKLDITKEWLEEVVNVIINSTKEEFNEAEDIIKKLQLVYQENNEYGKLESDVAEYSPFMPRDEDVDNNLTYLDELSMNVVHHEYVEIFKPLLKYEHIITELTSETLIQHILLLHTFEFFQKKEIREYLVDILTEDISWFDKLTNHQVKTLCSMPFIETVANNIYSKDTDIKLFLPTNFTPPKDIKSLEGEYEVIAVEKKSNLYELYLKMGLTEQNINSYIQEIIIPFLKHSDNNEDKKEVLKWLSVEWNNIKDVIEEEILEEFKESTLIPSLVDEKKLYKASELYDPTIELGKIFNDGLYMPISFSDKKVEEKWIELLSDLGASRDVLPQHIISKVKKIIDENNQPLAIDLLNFIANKFEVLEEMQFENSPMLDKLKEYAWYPVEEPKDMLKPKSEYTLLKRADELILFNDIKIAGGYYHVLHRKVQLGKKDEKGEIKANEMAKKIGITQTAS